MTDPERITAARRSVSAALLGRNHVASRLLSSKVSLTWDIACEAAERLAALEKENDALRTRLALEGIDD
jgi:Mn-dependent DtxR family transcriptional regulator